MDNWKPSTIAIHGGEEEKINGAVITPIFQSAMYNFANEQKYDDIQYMRCNNTPNHKVLNEKIAGLEKAEAALVTGSGMSSIASALLAFLPSGSHMMAHNNLYGGSYSFINEDLPEHGVTHSKVDAAQPETWQSQLKDNTKVFYVEGITNPLMQIPDLEAVIDFSRKNNLISIIDNTFATPILFRPLEMGFDIVVHSATKYMNGHSDIVAGATASSAKNIAKIVHKLNHLGGSLDNHACFLLQRGLKTLDLRVRHQCKSAMALAKHLSGHEKVKLVNYPGLETHPHHQRARQWFEDFGAMISFELNAKDDQLEAFINNLKLPMHAPSLGGVESLITRPATSSHLCIPREERLTIGLNDGLLRYSVGLESVDDLIADIDQALEKI